MGISLGADGIVEPIIQGHHGLHIGGTVRLGQEAVGGDNTAALVAPGELQPEIQGELLHLGVGVEGAGTRVFVLAAGCFLNVQYGVDPRLLTPAQELIQNRKGGGSKLQRRRGLGGSRDIQQHSVAHGHPHHVHPQSRNELDIGLSDPGLQEAGIDGFSPVQTIELLEGIQDLQIRIIVDQRILQRLVGQGLGFGGWNIGAQLRLEGGQIVGFGATLVGPECLEALPHWTAQPAQLAEDRQSAMQGIVDGTDPGFVVDPAPQVDPSQEHGGPRGVHHLGAAGGERRQT